MAIMSLTLTLASRNLLHDRLRFIATLVGIVFSVVLVMIQMGLFLGFGHMVSTMINHASTDLWVVPKGAKCFEDPSLLDLKLRDRVAATNGVATVIPLVIGFSDWRLDSGEMTPVFMVGVDLRDGGLRPWNVVEGNAQSLSQHDTVAVLINGTPVPKTFTASTLAGRKLKIHPIHLLSPDRVVKTSKFDRASGKFTIPARTAVVFWSSRSEHEGEQEGDH